MRLRSTQMHGFGDCRYQALNQGSLCNCPYLASGFPRFTDQPIPECWTPVRDLLASHANSKEFVVEVETDGTAYLRFGDDTPGLAAGLQAPSSLPRIASVTVPPATSALTLSPTWLVQLSRIQQQSSQCEIRFALKVASRRKRSNRSGKMRPSAFRIQERAVTPADYEEIAVRKDVADRCGIDVQRAAATLRWTGSWHTMFVTRRSLGGAEVNPDFEKKVAWLPRTISHGGRGSGNRWPALRFARNRNRSLHQARLLLQRRSKGAAGCFQRQRAS